MGKYVAKCSKGVGEVAVMEVTQVVGVRTRARALALSSAAAVAVPKRRKAAAVPSELVQTSSYLQLRSRRLVMTSRRDRPLPGNSSSAVSKPALVEETSRCSSNTSSEVGVDKEVSEDLETSTCDFESGRERREVTPSSEARRSEPVEVETTGGASSSSGMARSTPIEIEIEEFFAGVEREQAQRFAERYNYDVINDVPLDGRYHWVRLC